MKIEVVYGLGMGVAIIFLLAWILGVAREIFRILKIHDPNRPGRRWPLN
jgi:hypothetical protein